VEHTEFVYFLPCWDKNKQIRNYSGQRGNWGVFVVFTVLHTAKTTKAPKIEGYFGELCSLK
jgi:hypothetical protein